MYPFFSPILKTLVGGEKSGEDFLEIPLHRGRIQKVHLNSYTKRDGGKYGFRFLLIGEDDSFLLAQQVKIFLFYSFLKFASKVLFSFSEAKTFTSVFCVLNFFVLLLFSGPITGQHCVRKGRSAGLYCGLSNY